MATADVSTMAIAGLHRPPTSHDFAMSLAVLPHPEEQPEISDGTLNALGELFVRHSAHNIFGIHLLHSHFAAPEGTVLFGVQFQVSGASQACWTKPVPAAELATESIHGHVFRLQSDGTFVPYEFHEGEASSEAAHTGPAFFRELAEFLHCSNLAGLIALQLLDGPRDKTNMELLAGPQSTVMMDEKDLIGFSPPRITTGWSFTVGDDGIICCKGNDVYSAKKNTQQVFQDSKPLPTVEALKEALRAEGVIA
ncbi:hypothetical protein TOPH_09238 [Tolypocladium ophioglossoides CBS 100239]|uniref:Uncharacterized protein n=1 Tax=Tolypocladium ophioglossoides (strain CBS 100239) TaxID=1163406 RepID=A0A0L0MXE7_TOLOC|nr:hypothetical protein TOPH_09238 [Tolypocladium ophioglossoides CBS 100239]